MRPGSIGCSPPWPCGPASRRAWPRAVTHDRGRAASADGPRTAGSAVRAVRGRLARRRAARPTPTPCGRASCAPATCGSGSRSTWSPGGSTGRATFQRAVQRVAELARFPGTVGFKVADELGYHDGLNTQGAGARLPPCHPGRAGPGGAASTGARRRGGAGAGLPARPTTPPERRAPARPGATSPGASIDTVSTLPRGGLVDRLDLSVGLLSASDVPRPRPDPPPGRPHGLARRRRARVAATDPAAGPQGTGDGRRLDRHGRRGVARRGALRRRPAAVRRPRRRHLDLAAGVRRRHLQPARAGPPAEPALGRAAGPEAGRCAPVHARDSQHPVHGTRSAERTSTTSSPVPSTTCSSRPDRSERRTR